VVYAFGQALKPAEHSLVTTSGPFFGLCTNYQVTAESVIRAVVRVDNAPSARAPNNVPRLVVESFNVLGPY
jgi:CTP synthase (UTP-ammonia lyase)